MIKEEDLVIKMIFVLEFGEIWSKNLNSNFNVGSFAKILKHKNHDNSIVYKCYDAEGNLKRTVDGKFVILEDYF